MLKCSGNLPLPTGAMLALHSELVKKGVAPVRTPAPADEAIPTIGVVMLAMLANIQQGADLVVRPGFGSSTDVGRHGFRVIDRLLDKRRPAPAFGVDYILFWRLYPSATFSTDPFLRFVRVFKFALTHQSILY